ncbi:hypothetical protein NVIE_008030 [Nitrososphaera viennensis EN76]|uniref:Uncharacterized protein n=1 Tax=Nitrososphaera viennensis EN76 TaxID=926571 RepID=A0A060HEC5_9ARCH|nr:hypothetical protein NVIE_008030 [Nitrososphaera viennensis EN76]
MLGVPTNSAGKEAGLPTRLVPSARQGCCTRLAICMKPVTKVT